MQAIEIKFLCPTDTKDARWKATTGGGTSRVYSQDYARNPTGNAARAAQLLAEELGWVGVWGIGSTRAGYVAVNLGQHGDPGVDGFRVGPAPAPALRVLVLAGASYFTRAGWTMQRVCWRLVGSGDSSGGGELEGHAEVQTSGDGALYEAISRQLCEAGAIPAPDVPPFSSGHGWRHLEACGLRLVKLGTWEVNAEKRLRPS